MNAKELKKLAMVTVLALSAMSARALIINEANGYLLGTAGGSPANEPAEIGRLNFMIGEYNDGGPFPEVLGTTTVDPGSQVPAAPLPLQTGSTFYGTGGFASGPINLGTGWDYLMVKWANTDVFYYVGGLSGIHTIDNDVVLNTAGEPQNASHYRLFNVHPGVPDGGLTLALLGMGLSGLWGVVRSQRKSS